MTHGLPGFFVVTDGLDGAGKGAVIKAIRAYLASLDLRIFDLDHYGEVQHRLPDFSNPRFKGVANPAYFPMDEFDAIISSEPTYAGIGQIIREEIINRKNGRSYSARVTAAAYALDRLVLYNRVIIPALKAGKIIVQSRSVSTSLTYQVVQGEERKEPLDLDEIMSLEGNGLALKHAPDCLIIPTVYDFDALQKRLSERDKNDEAIFEDPEFQKKLKPHYEGEAFKHIFTSRGTRLEYLDAGISEKHTGQEAVRIFKEVMGDRVIAK